MSMDEPRTGHEGCHALENLNQTLGLERIDSVCRIIIQHRDSRAAWPFKVLAVPRDQIPGATCLLPVHGRHHSRFLAAVGHYAIGKGRIRSRLPEPSRELVKCLDLNDLGTPGCHVSTRLFDEFSDLVEVETLCQAGRPLGHELREGDNPGIASGIFGNCSGCGYGLLTHRPPPGRGWRAWMRSMFEAPAPRKTCVSRS